MNAAVGLPGGPVEIGPCPIMDGAQPYPDGDLVSRSCPAAPGGEESCEVLGTPGDPGGCGCAPQLLDDGRNLVPPTLQSATVTLGGTTSVTGTTTQFTLNFTAALSDLPPGAVIVRAKGSYAWNPFPPQDKPYTLADNGGSESFDGEVLTGSMEWVWARIAELRAAFPGGTWPITATLTWNEPFDLTFWVDSFTIWYYPAVD